MFETLFAPRVKADVTQSTAWHRMNSTSDIAGSKTSPSKSNAATKYSDWGEVEVTVPPGPLGILLDGDCVSAAVIDEFCPLSPTNGAERTEQQHEHRKGAIECHGGVPRGSVLVSVNAIELLATHKTLAEIGDILRETAQMSRVLRFKVPPTAALSPASVKVAAANVNGNDATEATRQPSHTDTTAVSDSSSTRPTDLSLLDTAALVTVDVPPGPLGLQLDGAITDRSVVLAFVPLPNGVQRGAVEAHGGVPLGSELVAINGESVATLPLDAVRLKLSAGSNAARRLVFRPPRLTSPSAVTAVLAAAETATQRAAYGGIATTPHQHAPSSSVSVHDAKTKRRALELALVLKFDKPKIKRGECFFLIDARWLQRWATYVSQKDASAPGPITNESLLRSEWRAIPTNDDGIADVLRDGLVRPRDYRGIDPMVWCILSELHGADDAPLLARYTVDATAPALDTESIEMILREPRPTAMALVQKLLSKCDVETVDR